MPLDEQGKMERRIFVVPDLRLAGDGDGNQLTGHAAVFNRWSEDLGGFREIIKPACFARALQNKQDVRCLIDHESAKILGRTGGGANTLRLLEDDVGLAVDCDLPDVSYARDLRVSMKRKDITQMSFGFRTVTDRWGKQDGKMVRELIDVDLFDVSVVTFPAYPDTAAAVRSMQEYVQKFSHPLEDPAVVAVLAGKKRYHGPRGDP